MSATRAQAPAATPTTGAGVDRRAMTVLSLCHMFTDIAQGSIPALLPFLIAENHISIAAASALVLAATVSSSVIQPLFGLASDRLSLPWLMPLGPALGGLGVALVGFAPNYALTFAAVLLSGLGVAAFHPEGSRFANYVSGSRRASGMSRFSVGGNIGFALGPVFVTPLLIAFGLHGTAFLLIPTWAMAAVMIHELPRLKTFRRDVVGGRVRRDRHARGLGAVLGPGRGDRGPLVRVLRDGHVHPALLRPRPAHEQGARQRGAERDAAGRRRRDARRRSRGRPVRPAQRADRLDARDPAAGRRFPAVPPPILGVAFAALAGAATIATFAVTIVMGQEYLPGRLGVSAGVTIGLSIGLGGVGAPLLGLLADAHGLKAVFEVVAVLPFLALALTLALPRRTPRETNAAREASSPAGLRASAT